MGEVSSSQKRSYIMDTADSNKKWRNKYATILSSFTSHGKFSLQVDTYISNTGVCTSSIELGLAHLERRECEITPTKYGTSFLRSSILL